MICRSVCELAREPRRNSDTRRHNFGINHTNGGSPVATSTGRTRKDIELHRQDDDEDRSSLPVMDAAACRREPDTQDSTPASATGNREHGDGLHESTKRRYAERGLLRYDPVKTAIPGLCMAWALALVSLLAFLFAFASHSPGWMGLGVFVGLLCGIAAALVFIDRHVRASSRPEHMTDREVAALRGTIRKLDDANRQLPPSDTH